MNQFATEGYLPDLTIFLLVDPELGIKRKANQKALDRLEMEKLAFHQKVYDGYLMLAKRFAGRVVVVDGNCSIEEECAKVNEIVISFIKERGI